MFIKEIKNYDDEAQEADIIVSDDEFEVLCYAQPFENKKNKSFTLFGFGTENIMRALEETCFVEKIKAGYYDYRLQGKLIDLEKRLIAVGNILIEIEKGIPGDVKINEFVEFTVMRIDLVEKN